MRMNAQKWIAEEREGRMILCSTGALIGRPNGRNYRLLECCRERIRCDGYELMFYDSWYDQADDLLNFLQKIQLPVAVWHCEKSIGQGLAQGTEEGLKLAREKFNINCRLAGALGVKKMVMHLWDGMISDAYIDRNIAAFSWLQEIAAGYGIDLMIENVVCNQQDPLTHWKALAAAYPHIHFTFDTKMAAFHDQMGTICGKDWRWLWEGNHIRHLHINDYAGGYLDWKNLKTLHIGRGNIDFSAFFTHLRHVGYQGDYTVEATSFGPDGSIDFNALNQSLDALRRLSGRRQEP